MLPAVCFPYGAPSGGCPYCDSLWSAPPVCSPHRAHFLCAPPSTWAAQMLLQGPSSSSRNWSLILPCVLFSGVQPQPPCPLPCPGSGVSLILPCLFLRFSPSRPSPSVLGPVSGVSSPVCFPGFSPSPLISSILDLVSGVSSPVSRGSDPAPHPHLSWFWYQVCPSLSVSQGSAPAPPPIPVHPGSGVRCVLPCLFPGVQP